jgi:hypothetical protein
VGDSGEGGTNHSSRAEGGALVSNALRIVRGEVGYQADPIARGQPGRRVLRGRIPRGLLQRIKGYSSVESTIRGIHFWYTQTDLLSTKHFSQHEPRHRYYYVTL